MLRVGLTGNIGSGKSTVARTWERLGAHIVDADELARRAVERGSAGLDRVVAEFGRELLAADGSLDRSALRDRVFRDAAARERLERIVHPEVARLRAAEDARLSRDGVRLVVYAIPLLFEADLVDQVDIVVLVDAPASERIDRVVRDRGIARAEVERMAAAQMPSEQKRARADLVIDNDTTLNDLEREAERVWRELERRAASV